MRWCPVWRPRVFPMISLHISCIPNPWYTVNIIITPGCQSIIAKHPSSPDAIHATPISSLHNAVNTMTSCHILHPPPWAHPPQHHHQSSFLQSRFNSCISYMVEEGGASRGSRTPRGGGILKIFYEPPPNLTREIGTDKM